MKCADRLTGKSCGSIGDTLKQARSSVGERLSDAEEVGGSKPPEPTIQDGEHRGGPDRLVLSLFLDLDGLRPSNVLDLDGRE